MNADWWIEGHPNDALRADWKYYLDEAAQEPEVEAQLAKLREEYAAIKPEEIKMIDPCMGSGHILVYAFEVLMQIYTSAGWSEREAAQSILKNNLYGLDIDDRAAQLAYFAVMMKARQYDRRLLTRGIQPNVYAIRESNNIQSMAIEYFHQGDERLKTDIERLVAAMHDAKEYGSILSVAPVDFARLYARFDEIFDEIHMMRRAVLEQLLPMVQCAELLAQKYDVVVTNPPYMGGSGMDATLSGYVKKHYPDSKSDLFAVFIERCNELIKKNAFQGMITQHAWMFLSSYEKLRAKLLKVDIVNMAHLGARAFEEIGGEVVQTTSFVLRKSHIADCKGEYCRLIEPTTQQGKEDMFKAGENRYEADQSNFSKIPGAPVAYWVSDGLLNAFENKTVENFFTAVVKGIFTGDNARFLRLWHETNDKDFCVKWQPYSKGGDFRRWYGNLEYIINWENNGRDLRNFAGSGLGASKYFGKETIVWTKLTSYKTGFRNNPDYVYFDDASPALIGQSGTRELCFLALLNSIVFSVK